MSRVVDWGRDKFQVMLKSRWSAENDAEDMALKRAYEAGQSKVRYDARGENYEVSFNSMTQMNTKSKKVRWIRHRALPTRYAKPKKAPGGTKVQVQPGQQTMDAKPPPKKGCCPSCKCACCTMCIAIPIIGLIVIAIIGDGDLSAGADQVVDAAMDQLDAAEGALEGMGEAVGSIDLDSQFEAAMDAMDAASDEVAEAMGQMGEYLSEMDHF